jgi:hypothetical protein
MTKPELTVAQQVLLFGIGADASGAVRERLIEMKNYPGDVAERVVGSVVLDETHLTEDQLLAKAREVCAGLASQETTYSPMAKTGGV